MDGDDDSFPTAIVYAVRPEASIARRVRERSRRKGREDDVVPMRMAMVVASLALLRRKYRRRSMRERAVESDEELEGDKGNERRSVLRRQGWWRGE